MKWIIVTGRGLACYICFITQAILNNLDLLLFIVFQSRYQISYEMLSP